MKTLFIFTLVTLLMVSCKSKEETLSDKFKTYIFDKHSNLKKGNQLLFIVNKPECPPCIKAIEQTMAASYKAQKNVILFGQREVSIPAGSKILSGSEKELSSYGMLGIDGTICVFTNGALAGSLSFDTQDPETAITQIKTLLNAKITYTDNPSARSVR